MMIFIALLFITVPLAHGQDICRNINCGSGTCTITQNPALPYFCRCPSGANTVLPCPHESPCARNPCGVGTCELAPTLTHGYLCRCPGDMISLTACNVTRSGCYSNPCINGLCIEGLASFYCNCLPSWTGKLCDEKIISPCSKQPCNPGKCFQIDDRNIPFVCLCPNGQFALSCQTFGYRTSSARILPSTTTTTTVRPPYSCNPLDPQACLNGGQCMKTTDHYRCVCNPGYTGHFCESNINECESNPCQNGGICYDLDASYICYCPDGVFRAKCFARSIATSTISFCPCQNGGSCAILGTEVCICPSGFTGRFCENKMTTQRCLQNQCLNGGTCHQSSSDMATCTCRSGFTGKSCETEYFRCRSNGRFTDKYNCIEGKYFECVHFQQGSGSNSYGMLLSRTCPSSLRFNTENDRCDYSHNVPCPYAKH